MKIKQQNFTNYEIPPIDIGSTDVALCACATAVWILRCSPVRSLGAASTIGIVQQWRSSEEIQFR